MKRLTAKLPAGPAIALGVGILVVGLLPVVFDLSSYYHNLFTLSFLIIAGSLAWNWMGGFVGQVSFGHATLFGIGGFMAARIILAGALPAPLAWIVGALVAGVVALGAHPMLRLRGPYFSIATIGVNEASRVIFTYWDGFTGGSSGLSLPVDMVLKYQLYWWALGLAGLAAAASWLLRHSSLGLQLLAIKADVEAAGDVGVSATFYQDLMFCISGAVVGLSGALYASYYGYIEPADLFGFDRSIGFVLTAVIGGVGTVFGPIYGAVVFVILREYLLASYPQLYLGLYGGLLIVIILFEPLGLTGVGRRIWKLVRRK